MVLGTQEIKQLIKNNNMELLDKNIQSASLDLRLNDKVSIYKNISNNKPIEISLADDNIENVIKQHQEDIDLAKGYYLKPQEYIYGQSFETINMPNNMCGIVISRSSFARLGLILPISQFINPGYCGNLPIIIYNASNFAVEIPPYHRIAQIIFLEVKGDITPYNQQIDSKYQNENHKNRKISFKDNEFNNNSQKISSDEMIKILRGE